MADLPSSDDDFVDTKECLKQKKGTQKKAKKAWFDSIDHEICRDPTRREEGKAKVGWSAILK